MKPVHSSTGDVMDDGIWCCVVVVVVVGEGRLDLTGCNPLCMTEGAQGLQPGLTQAGRLEYAPLDDCTRCGRS